MPRVRPQEPLDLVGRGVSFALLVGVVLWTCRQPVREASAVAPVHARAPDARPVDAARQMGRVTLAPGKGPAVRAGERVEIRFWGGRRLGEGSRSFTVGRGEVMPGWDEGVVGMQVGEKRRLVIPPAMLSADLAADGVPLSCEVELVAIGGPAILE
jgi:hypothetical protein